MADTAHDPEWWHSQAPVDYLPAVATMEERVASIVAGTARECVWLTEHPPVYTLGTTADPDHILNTARLPVLRTGRGGSVTYHGPGQRVAYVMLDLRARGRDIRAFVRGLQDWVIAALRDFGVHGTCREDRIGVWVRDSEGREAKIAALGVRVRKGVTFHGVSVNVHPDLAHYAGIVPCGIRDAGVTSLRSLGNPASMAEVDEALQRRFVEAMPPRLPDSSASHPV